MRFATRRTAAALLAVLGSAPGVLGFIAYDNGPLRDADLLAEAERLYGGGDLAVYPAGDPQFEAAFPDFQLYAVVDASMWPERTHTMAYDPRVTKAYDVTSEFNQILAAAGATILSGDDALRYAKAFATTGNSDFQAQREIVDSGDSERLERQIYDPEAMPLIDGYEVLLSTWAPENGVLLDWRLGFGITSITYVRTRVRDVGLGQSYPDGSATGFLRGDWVKNDYTVGFGRTTNHETAGVPGPPNPNLDPKLLSYAAIEGVEATNYDGTRWVAEYPVGEPVTPDLVLFAQELVNAASLAYNTTVRRNVAGCGSGLENPGPDWGLDSEDPDCVLQLRLFPYLTLQCNVCVEGSLQHRVYIYTSYREVLAAQGLYNNPAVHTGARVGLVQAGSMLYASLQYAVNDWKLNYRVWRAGMVRFSQTVLDPGVEHEASGQFYATALTPLAVPDPPSASYFGVNAYMLFPHRHMCEHDNSYALYWGYLYAYEGGMPTLNRFLVEIGLEPVGTPCNLAVSRSISDALAFTNAPHSTHGDALVAFAERVWRRDFTWGANDGSGAVQWGDYLLPVAKGAQAYQSRVNYVLQPWGLRYTDIVSAQPYKVVVDCPAGDPQAWDFKVWRIDALAGIAPLNVSCPGSVTVDPVGYAEVVFRVVRKYHQPLAGASYTVTIDPA